MRRIRREHLESIVRVLNNAFDYALDPYALDGKGQFKSNPNTYSIEHGNGGYALVQNEPVGSGDRLILGRCGPSELHAQIVAYVDGIRAMQKHVKGGAPNEPL